MAFNRSAPTLSVIVLAMAGVVVGCGRKAEDPLEGIKPEPVGIVESRNDQAPAERLLEPFEPPSLEELDRRVKWVARPVRNALALMGEEQRNSPPKAAVAEALDRFNDSVAANEVILDTLGRLPTSETSEVSERVDRSARIDRHVGADLNSTNPIMISSTTEFDVLGLTGFGLFSFDRKLDPFASSDVAVSWDASIDGLYDRVILRDDLVWSDGEPITAHDVAFTFQVIMDPNVPVPAVRSGTDQLRWVHAYDDRTIVFFHKEPLATNVWNINFPVLPRHVYQDTWKDDPTLKESDRHVELEQSPISGGPYEIVERSRGQQIVLRRRRGWTHVGERQVREEPFFEEVRFRVIEDPNTALLGLTAGEIEEMILNPEQWTTQTGGTDFTQRNTKVTAPEWVSFHFGWNLDTPFFSDKRVRRAMSYAFDHREMLEKLCYGLYRPAAGNYPDDSWMAPRKPLAPYSRNLDTAEDLLDEAGWTDHDQDGVRDKVLEGRSVPFEFTILTGQQPLRIAICELLRQNLEQVGVRVNVRPVEATVLQQQTLEKKFQAYFGGWGSGTDPDTSENIWATGAGRNFVNYSNPEVDRLFAEGRRELDREKRATIYARIQEILYEDQPYTWLFWRNSFHGFSKELRGYVFSPRGPFNYSPGFGSIWKPRFDP
ncbi:MAG: peptide-binding protein [Planctomycetaceae bacterium]